MAYVEMICLANSRKRGGRCVVGLRTDGQGWLRPVAPYEDGALYGQHYTLDDGSQAQMLDVLMVDVVEPVPAPHQPENWLVGQETWKLVSRPAGRKEAMMLASHVQRGPELLRCETNKMPLEAFQGMSARSSAALVAPMHVDWEIKRGFEGRRQVRARFALGRVRYDLVVTDPDLEQRLSHLQEGSYYIPSPDDERISERFLLTISLGEEFNGFHYKLVAGVAAIPRAWRSREGQRQSRAR